MCITTCSAFIPSRSEPCLRPDDDDIYLAIIFAETDSLLHITQTTPSQLILGSLLLLSSQTSKTTIPYNTTTTYHHHTLRLYDVDTTDTTRPAKKQELDDFILLFRCFKTDVFCLLPFAICHLLFLSLLLFGGFFSWQGNDWENTNMNTNTITGNGNGKDKEGYTQGKGGLFPNHSLNEMTRE